MLQFVLLKQAVMIYYSQLKCRTFLDLFWHLKQLFIRLVTSHIDAMVLAKASLGCRKTADINVDSLKNLFKKLIGWKLLIFSGSSRGESLCKWKTMVPIFLYKISSLYACLDELHPHFSDWLFMKLQSTLGHCWVIPSDSNSCYAILGMANISRDT